MTIDKTVLRRLELLAAAGKTRVAALPDYSLKDHPRRYVPGGWRNSSEEKRLYHGCRRRPSE